MSTINTNSSAMAALQVLNANNRALEESQNRVSTGLKVSNAKDNSSVYQIAQNMRSQISSWKAVNANLDRAKGALDVTQTATMMIADLLTEMKTKALSFQDKSIDTVSRTAIQNDLKSLIQQIKATAQSASFDGISLITGSGNSIIDLNPMSTTGTYTQSGVTLTLNGQILTAIGSTGGLNPATDSGVLNVDFNISSASGYKINLLSNIDGNPLTTYSIAQTSATSVASGQYIQGHQNLTIMKSATASGGLTFDAWPEIPYPTSALYPTPTLKMNAAAFIPDAPSGGVSFMSSPNGGSIDINKFPMTSASLNLDNLDFSDPDSVAAKIGMAFSFVNAKSAYFGTQSNAIDATIRQNNNMVDALTTGVGNLVDADMAKESANIQSIQIKQQLSVQSLSIANKSTDWILSLFK
jgi:flagellin